MTDLERTYDYDAKNTWRDWWMEKVLPPAFTDHEHPTGLYLPAPENLELPGYLKKGLKPDDLYGVECDDALYPRVKRAAKGIRLVHGQPIDVITKIVDAKEPRLTFVNLDYTGGITTDLDQALVPVFRAFPAAPHGFLAVTVYGSRVPEELDDGIVNTSKFFSGLSGDAEEEYRLSRFYSEYEPMLRRHTQLKQYLGSRMPDHNHLHRELGFLWWATVAMGFTDYESGYGRLDEAFLASVRGVLDRISAKAEKASTDGFLGLVSDRELGRLLATRRVKLWPMDFTHLVYRTQNKHPMLTWFMKIVVLEDDLPTAQELLDQTWRLARLAPLHFIERDGSTITFGE